MAMEWQTATQFAKDSEGNVIAAVNGQWIKPQQYAQGQDGGYLVLAEGGQGQAKPEAKQPASPSPAKPASTSEPSLLSSLPGGVKRTGMSALEGGIMGAATPEILGAAGKALSAAPNPIAKGIGATLSSAGLAATESRLLTAAGGALTSGASTGMEQVTEALMGGPNAVSKTVGMAAMVAMPTLEHFSSFISKSASTAWRGVRALTQGAEQSASEAVKRASAILGSDSMKVLPQNDVYAALQRGVTADLSAAEQLARKTLSDAESQANRIREKSPSEAAKLMSLANHKAETIMKEAHSRAGALQAASDRNLTTAVKVKAMGDQELKTIGNPLPISDIGKPLQQAAVTKQGEALTARREAYKALEEERNQIVAQKEASGQFILDDPEIKAFRAEIDRKTLATVKGREAAGGMADVVDKGLERAYTNLREALTNRRVQTGVNDAGNPTFTTYKTSFEAIDAVRRKLWQVSKGHGPVEGYDAMGADVARKAYHTLSQAQARFAGDIQHQLQSEYAAASEGLNIYKSAGARKLTAFERYDPESLVKDPATIPSEFFSSQQSVKDLKELTGNPGMVEDAARQFTATMLQGKSASGAREWINNPAQKDWMREIPGLMESASRYAKRLDQIESLPGVLMKRAESRMGQAGKVMETADTTAQKVRKEGAAAGQKMLETRGKEAGEVMKSGEKAAEGTRQQALEKVKGVVKAGMPPEAVNKLMKEGTQEEVKTAARYLAGEPGGAKALEGSVRSIMAATSPAKLQRDWEWRIKPMLESMGTLSAKQMEGLEKDVGAVLKAKEGKQAVKYVDRLVQRALAGSAGAVGGMVGL